MTDTVYLGVSGGVDSALSILLLKEKNYHVIGVTFIFTDEYDVADAKSICKFCGIEHIVLDLRKDFHRLVIERFKKEYESGKTPNPCVYCNPNLKWHALGSLDPNSLIATGHYAKIKKVNDRYTIMKNIAKDQSYFLYGLQQSDLKRTIFPLSDYTKDQVRALAKEKGIPVYNKKDSQEICFIHEHYSSFLEQIGAKTIKGYFLTENGEILGRHKGLFHYTIGQRKGLGLSLGKPLFVKAFDHGNIILSEENELYQHSFIMKHVNFVGIAPCKNYRGLCKIRSGHLGDLCQLTQLNAEEYLCTFEKAQRAISPGQSAVFYQEDYLALGGVIDRVVEEKK